MDMQTKKIMIIEDDETIRRELAAVLKHNGYHVLPVSEFGCVLETVRAEDPHLILLDINLPGQDGFTLCTDIREFSQVPIIFVTSRDDNMDELNGMMIGGDDFVTKPYHISILLARINALIKRTYFHGGQDTIVHRGVSLHIEAGKVEHNGQTADLTKSELKILAYLFRQREKIVQRADLVDYLWDNQVYVDDNALSVHITRLRSKLESIGVRDFIQTKHRQGYTV